MGPLPLPELRQRTTQPAMCYGQVEGDKSSSAIAKMGDVDRLGSEDMTYRGLLPLCMQSVNDVFQVRAHKIQLLPNVGQHWWQHMVGYESPSVCADCMSQEARCAHTAPTSSAIAHRRWISIP